MTLDEIFKKSVEKNASDVHLVVGEPPIIRINGVLCQLDELGNLTRKKAEELILSILNPKQKEQYITNRELDISYELGSGERFRINLHFEKGNPSLVARIINLEPPTMESTDMPEIVYRLADLHQGLIILTGPTGCGKSTSLAAIIDYINKKRSANIITLEDPMEFIFQPDKSIIRQRQYNFDFISFPEALKHVLRQDPNVIMVGEMRDLETISSTITLAETGHLVLTTLHTPNASQTVDRIIDIFPPHQQDQIRMQLSMSLVGVIAQQLLPAPDGQRRVVAREIMINTPAVANLIRENKIAQIKTVIQTSSDDGMISMDQYLQYLVKNKKITKEVAKEYVIDGAGFDE
ncbi:PilT/PilU family type 4a pilus ATPase [Candidatus Kuenenbacteria bacterium]|nr:PilT/PilU family type 4a pilus ATPase [Candidatus Kuenenbacteria bacterium]